MPVVRRPSVACLFVLVLAAFVAGGCAGSDAIPDDAICRVGETTVSKDRQDQAYAAARAQTRARTGKAPTKSESATLRRQVAAQLVSSAAWRSIAKDEDVTVDDKDVKRAEKELIKTGFDGDRTRYEAQLKVEGRTAAQARADLRDQLYVEAVRDHVGDDVKVGNDEIERYLEDHAGDFGGTPRSRKVQHILIRPGGKSDARDDAAAKAFIERTRREVDGASESEFAAVAKRFSDDPSYGPTGGSFTYEAGTIDPAFEDAAFSLDEGELSKPIKTRLGWHLIIARGPIRDAKLPDPDKVRDQVREAALAAKREAVFLKLQHRIERLVKDADCRAAYRTKAQSSTSTTTSTTSTTSTATRTTPASPDDPEPETATP